MKQLCRVPGVVIPHGKRWEVDGIMLLEDVEWTI